MATIPQETRETALITTIALATAETAAPTLPNTGGEFTWSGSDFTPVTFALSDDDISFGFTDGESVDVKAPGDIQVYERHWIELPGVLNSVEIQSYEIGAKVLDACTNWADASGVHTISSTVTKTAVIIEFSKVAWLYIPSAEIHNMALSGGRTSLGKQGVMILPTATDDVPAGFQILHFQDAA